ncbi:Fumarate hydratase, partial [human gut metagenome]
ALLALRKQLIPQLKTLTQTLSEKSRAFADIVKIGRTHLQDATPLTLGQEISGWVAMLEHNLKHIVEEFTQRVAYVLLDCSPIFNALHFAF